MNKLTNEQIIKLRETLAKQVLEGMDLESLENYAFEQLHDYFSSLTESDLLEETRNIFDGAPIDEII
jgi:hypothetical protein